MKKIIFALFVLTILFPNVSRAFVLTGFQNPYGVAIDGRNGKIFVSNVNGATDAQDGNGFISRISATGEIEELRSIEGSAKSQLDAPKGIQVLDSRIYVADIDKIRVFDVDTKTFLYNVNFGTLPVGHFYDIEAGPDGALYVTDAKKNTIYKIDVARQHEVTVFAEGDFLAEPRGISWSPKSQLFFISSWGVGQVIALDRAGKQQSLPSIFLSEPESLASGTDGNVYVSSFAMSGVYRIAENIALYGFALGVSKPAGVVVHSKLGQLIVASFDGNTVVSYKIDSVK